MTLFSVLQKKPILAGFSFFLLCKAKSC